MAMPIRNMEAETYKSVKKKTPEAMLAGSKFMKKITKRAPPSNINLNFGI